MSIDTNVSILIYDVNTYSAKGGQKMQTVFTCIMGIGTVFVGLIALIAITMAMSAVIRMISKPGKEAGNGDVNVPASKTAPIENKQEIIAGVCAVIAEELGTDVSNIRVTSFKKL